MQIQMDNLESKVAKECKEGKTKSDTLGNPPDQYLLSLRTG